MLVTSWSQRVKRKMGAKLPELYMLIATYRLVRVKEKTKAYTDKAKNTKQSDIQFGDQVLVKDKKTNSPHHSIQCNPKWLARLATVSL